jgi:GTPase SAR1 family protein
VVDVLDVGPNMKTLLIFLLSAVCLPSVETPTVEVYLIRKFDAKAEVPQMPSTILEIANPTDKTFFVNGNQIESPFHDIEAKRDGKLLLLPRFSCGTGSEAFPLRPGRRMLVTVSFPWDEATARFRFYFFTSADDRTRKVVTVRSRPIERKELGDLSGTAGEVTSDKKLNEPETDEDLNKRIEQSKGPRVPFAE